MLIAISISLTTHHIQRVAGAAVDAAAAVDAVGVAEEAILGIAGRVEAKGAGFGTETALDACVRDANGGASRIDRLVDFPHRADGASVMRRYPSLRRIHSRKNGLENLYSSWKK